MRKVFFKTFGAVAFGAVVAFNVSVGLRSENLSDMTLANSEVLAFGEGYGGNDWWVEVSSTRTLRCSEGFYVIRCDYGGGNCDPSWQDLCNGIVYGWEH